MFPQRTNGRLIVCTLLTVLSMAAVFVRGDEPAKTTASAAVILPDPAGRVTNSLGMRLVPIPPGEFLMGSPDSYQAARDREKPQHKVKITKRLLMGMYCVTQAEFEKVIEKNPSWFSKTGGGKRLVTSLDTTGFPVETVTWHEAVEFCRKLSTLPEEKAAGRIYRLPTEAEWEYACRAGTATTFHYGDSLSPSQAHFNKQLERTTRVGNFKPNAFGLYDMHGNVWEWCSDWAEPQYYQHSPTIDPQGPSDEDFKRFERIVRGGSWYFDAAYCRAAFRSHFSPTDRCFDIGFRVVVSR